MIPFSVPLMPFVSTNLWVFCFKTAGGWVCIDFKWLPVLPGWLYIVPAGHCIWGLEALLEGCLRTEIKESLPQKAQYGLEGLLFALEKRIFLPAENSASLETAAIVEVLTKLDGAAPVTQQTFIQKKATVQFYHELAGAFYQQVKQWGGDEKQKSVPEFASLLHQQERTLRRACVATYGLPPVEMLMYQKALIGARLLVETDLKLADIAHHLGFADESTCSRFLKGKMGMCPMDFRQRIWVLREGS